MILTWLAWRLAKWLSVALFTAGLALSVLPDSPRTRRLGAFAVATPGLLLVWMTGYALMKQMDLELSNPSIRYTLIAGLVALGGAVLGAVMRHRSLGLALTTGGLTAAFGFMTAKTDPTAMIALGVVVPLIAAVIAGLIGLALPNPPPQAAESRAAIGQWFGWIARAEGVSLLVLFGVFMPLKYGAGIEIDGGDGWVGWIHGVLVFLYLLALGTGVLFARWGILAAILGFVASLLPFGTFVFEWWLSRRTEAAPHLGGPVEGQ